MADVYIGVGANVGDARASMRTALYAMSLHCDVTAVSSLYATEPVGFLAQDWFLNAAIHATTWRTPAQFLEALQGIEKRLGRQREIPNGPRTIDLDILVWDDAVIDEGGLVVPHPRMQERLFVMEPLFEIAPQLVIPGLGKTVAELRDELQGSMRVDLAARAPW
ncbi:MAG: 2-amino-4-hydroxy-6-hydroxymethyldihydropteridine diphosphokinase [Acidobacteriota bacterium]